MNSDRNGLILINKPAGLTSFKVLGKIKKQIGIKKIGHAGTLDKFATGLLIVLIGQYTKLASYFTSLDKEYIAAFKFGVQTDTLDPEGEEIKTGDIPNIDRISEVFEKYKGSIMQVPPLYSAVHHKGNRAYKLVRKGIKPILSPREVKIYSIDIISFKGSELILRVHCSKGTYIRALARDVALECNSCAYVKALKRISIGTFNVKDAVSPDAINIKRDIRSAMSFLNSLPEFEMRIVKPDYESKIYDGAPLQDDFFIYKCAGDTPKGAGDTPKGAGDTPKGAGDTPKGAGDTPKAIKKTDKKDRIDRKKADKKYALFTARGDLIAIVRREAACKYKYLAVFNKS